LRDRSMKPEEKRKRIFDVFAKNWQLILPIAPFDSTELHNEKFLEAVMCPICMVLYNRNGLDQTVNNPLTIEHCPPEELGGKPMLLLCKSCNNTAGSELDVKLMEYLNVRPFNERQPEGRVMLKNSTFKGGALDVRGTMELKRIDANSFYIDLKATDTYRKNRFDNILKADKIEITYKQHETPSLHIVHTALLKIGYLLAFAKFGHPFILNPNYDAIRAQIANPSATILPIKGVVMNTSLGVGVHLISEPKHFIGFAVVFELNYNGKKDVHAVLLNHPDTADLDFYKGLVVHQSEVKQIRATKIADLDFLGTMENIEAYFESISAISPYGDELLNS
jgi:hypothetical protein